MKILQYIIASSFPLFICFCISKIYDKIKELKKQKQMRKEKEALRTVFPNICLFFEHFDSFLSNFNKIHNTTICSPLKTCNNINSFFYDLGSTNKYLNIAIHKVFLSDLENIYKTYCALNGNKFHRIISDDLKQQICYENIIPTNRYSTLLEIICRLQSIGEYEINSYCLLKFFQKTLSYSTYSVYIQSSYIRMLELIYDRFYRNVNNFAFDETIYEYAAFIKNQK